MKLVRIAESIDEAELIRTVSRLISEITGVQLGEKQYSLVQGRLAKRMRELKTMTPGDYARHFNQNRDIEVGVLTSLLTTHHTFFFREFQHFEHLLRVTLPSLIASHRSRGIETIRIWSAACSRGQEVYSLAMFLKHHLPQIAPGMKFEIIGTDICEESIKIATNGVYSWEELKPVPSVYLQGNWSRGTGEIAKFVRAREELRKHVSFRVANLQALNPSPFGMGFVFDVIFCRNVFIYFNQNQIRSISIEFLKMLNPAGHLFVGVSESLNGLGLPLEWIGPSVYALKASEQRPAVTRSAVSPGLAQDKSPESPRLVTPIRAPKQEVRRLRVLCVDDSPTVLMLLNRILSPQHGFEVVGTASNGEEAAQKVSELRPDVVTLDIHMPKVNGVEYLERFRRRDSAPVVMVSSVSREDASLAFKALELGASDYIEKPSVENLERIAEELYFKLRATVESSARDKTNAIDLDKSFKRPPLISRPHGKLRLVLAPFISRDEVLSLLPGFRAPQPPTLVLVDGAPKEIFVDWARQAALKFLGGRSDPPNQLNELAPNTFTFLELERGIELIRKSVSQAQMSTLVLGPLSPAMIRKIATLPSTHLIIEDRGGQSSVQAGLRSHHLIPVTSFVYESDRFFAELEGAA